MAKKISTLILSVAIVVTGVIGFGKLRYWERSVRIFSYNSNSSFERRGRGAEGFESGEGFWGQAETGRFDSKQLPDSLRTNFRRDMEQRERMQQNLPDSLRQEISAFNGNSSFRGGRDGNFRNMDRRGRGGFHGGSNINLRNVTWFLAVFALLTLVTIYADKLNRYLSVKRKAVIR
jgi:hypothetical protein